MNKYIYLILAVLLGGSASAQVVLRNSGKINVAGGSLVISGSYQNESSGGITLDGIITVSGNWTNNGSGNIIENPVKDGLGEVIFNGTDQTIGGTGATRVFDFEKLTILNDSVNVEAGKGVTTYSDCKFTAAPLVLKTTEVSLFRSIMATFINNGTDTTNIRITAELYYRSTGTSAAPPAVPAGRGLYFSSPIKTAKASILKVPTNILYYQDEIARKYVLITTAQNLTVGKGYFIRSATHNTFKFTGTPNTNASYKTSIPKWDDKHYYLLGNPYPSVINWNTIDTTDNMSSTIWYRTCDANGAMVVADTYNGATDEGTNNYGAVTDQKVDGKIPPMQSFWVQCRATTAKPTISGSITIKDSDRTHDWGKTEFFKSSAKQNKDVLRLYLFSGNQRDEIIFIQSKSAQNNFDNWDSRKFFLGDIKIAELYTLSPESYNLTIQSVKPITKADSIIAVGVNVGTAGTYKFTADLSKTKGSHNIYLYDKLEDVKQDLFINPEYTFTSVVENTTSRFSLIFTPVPKLITSAPAYVCYPETVDLTSSSITVGSDNGLTYTYWLNANATIPYPTPNKAETGTYYIKGTASNGSYSISIPIEVIVNPAPTVLTTNPAPIIYPATADLTIPEITFGSSTGLSYSYWLDLAATILYPTPQAATVGSYYIKGTYDFTGCFAIAGPVIVTANLTGVDDNLASEINIYSLNKQIFVENCKPNSVITIFDITGRQIYTRISKSDKEIIPLNNNTGIYIVKVVNTLNVKSQKVYLR